VIYALCIIHIQELHNVRKKVTTRKKATKQGNRYRSIISVECVIHMTGDTVQSAFNHLSYESLF